MAEYLRRYLLVYLGLRLILLEHLPKPLTGHARAARVDEQRGLARHYRYLLARASEIVGNCRRRLVVYRYHPLVTALAHADKSGGQVHVGQVERYQLAHPHPRCVQQFEYRAVAIALEVDRLGLAYQQIYLVACENHRQLLFRVRRGYRVKRVRVAFARRPEIGVKTAQRRQSPCHRRSRFSTVSEVFHILLRLRRRNRRKALNSARNKPCGELAQVAHIRLDRVLRRVLRAAQVCFVSL